MLERHPDMTPVTRMAFAFIGETIRRDTEKWREKHERYAKAARRRRQESAARDPGDEAWGYVE